MKATVNYIGYLEFLNLKKYAMKKYGDEFSNYKFHESLMKMGGFLQRLTSYESGNIRRLITGILFGISFIFAFAYFHHFCLYVAGMILKFFGADPAVHRAQMGNCFPLK